MVAIPIKKKIVNSPNAKKVPMKDAKKLLKKFMYADFVFKDRVCEIVLRNLP